ncbi:polyphosphate polymerase domain-containing protein [Microbacterium sp. H1-D42]|uniref:polyphosphate polymerase domain-containing protein n=1 Tax=Microbacterium sp. H1-D42 TaxID=2925844 RepID=UPI001F52D677|nr:polyphosphate polymerase domain-containing protein [Microbacterium sp. H1-D42]UNK72190.1 polyphosphate polymerase domain-containing protein [Microbacterium sp. H1-D42]
MSALAQLVRELPPISLPELDESAALMSRIDRKYFIPRDMLTRLLPDGLRVLQIGETRTFRYRTVYLDTPDFAFFRQHVQRRRHRFKVRTRLYVDSGDCRLEVKSKGLRGMTVKQRQMHDPSRLGLLDHDGHAYVGPLIGMDATRLRPVLETDYRRTTLTDGDHRITIDQDLDSVFGAKRIPGPAEVLVETKSADGMGALDRLLVHSGIRPHSVSKYCLAASLLYPQLPGNDWGRIRRRYWGA